MRSPVDIRVAADAPTLPQVEQSNKNTNKQSLNLQRTSLIENQIRAQRTGQCTVVQAVASQADGTGCAMRVMYCIFRQFAVLKTKSSKCSARKCLFDTKDEKEVHYTRISGREVREKSPIWAFKYMTQSEAFVAMDGVHFFRVIRI